MVRVFLDTFAIMEIIKGNESYAKHLDSELFTSLLNLYEMYYNLLKVMDEKESKDKFFQFKQFLTPINDSHIFLASEFRRKSARLKLSYVDALGYSIAKEEGMKFLTGDRAFEGLDNVEFVKG